MKTAEIYELICRLPQHSYVTPLRELPLNGIYLFFEEGQSVSIGSESENRIVRIGTHRQSSRFPIRVRQHYGNVHSYSGHKNSSVFRKHVGGAILRRDGPDDPRIKEWLRQGGAGPLEVEEAVSKVLRDRFSFVCFTVEDQLDRLSLERGLIAQLAQHPISRLAVETWLGQYAAAKEIRKSGLWNTQHVHSEPLTQGEGLRLRELIEAEAGD